MMRFVICIQVLTLTDFAGKGIFAPNFSLLIGKYFVLIDQTGKKIHDSVIQPFPNCSKVYLLLLRKLLTNPKPLKSKAFFTDNLVLTFSTQLVYGRYSFVI